MTNKFVWNYLFGEKMNHYFILFYSVQINPTIAACPAIIYFLFWKYFIIFQDAFIKTCREIDDIETPSSDAKEDRVNSGEDADQLVGSVHVRLHEGLRRLLAVRPLQSNQIPGNFFYSFFVLFVVKIPLRWKISFYHQIKRVSFSSLPRNIFPLGSRATDLMCGIHKYF